MQGAFISARAVHIYFMLHSGRWSLVADSGGRGPVDYHNLPLFGLGMMQGQHVEIAFSRASRDPT